MQSGWHVVTTARRTCERCVWKLPILTALCVSEIVTVQTSLNWCHQIAKSCLCSAGSKLLLDHFKYQPAVARLIAKYTGNQLSSKTDIKSIHKVDFNNNNVHLSHAHNALSTHIVHINLNMIFYTYVEHSPIKNNLHQVFYGNTHCNEFECARHARACTHTHTHTHTHFSTVSALSDLANHDQLCEIVTWLMRMWNVLDSLLTS